MSRCINKAILIGRLGTDPEVRFTSSGIAVVNVSLATNESYTNKEGEQVDKTEWHRLVFWRQLAEIAGQYLRKGASVYVEGTLRYRTWTDDGGHERFTCEVEVKELSMLDGRRDGLNGHVPDEDALEATPF
jgi:single-strand DNA-binding protein